MKIEFAEVNRHNIIEVSRLHTSVLQKGMVETVEECFREAQQLSLWKPVVISKDKEMIGFAMFGLWKETGEEGRVWLDRFFIDENFQRRGYSKIVLPLLLCRIVKEYQCDKIYLSVYEENTVAIHLYQIFGFRFNGEADINGEKVMVLSGVINLCQ